VGDELMKILPPEHQKLIRDFAENTPSLADLTLEQAQAVAQAVLGDFLKDKMKRAVLAERIRFETEKDLFLKDQRSPHTRRAYQAALASFGRWLEHKNVGLPNVTPALADDFIRDQKAGGLDEDSVRLKVATVSSFFTFLGRRFAEIQNPFRGTKVRPRGTHATAIIPTPAEIEVIVSNAEPDVAATVSILAETGLRVGGLAELRIKSDGTFHTVSKGKKFLGFEPISEKTLKRIENAGLSTFRPFSPDNHPGRGGEGAPADLITAALSMKVSRLCKKLHKAGLISASFSAHDFRHAFAETHSDKGLLWLRDRLGHSSISITERYLRNSLRINLLSR